MPQIVGSHKKPNRTQPVAGLMAKRRLYPDGVASLFMYLALMVLYIYLILAGYLMMGVVGLLFVSLLFLVALLFPYFYRKFRTSMKEKGTAGAAEPLPPASGLENEV